MSYFCCLTSYSSNKHLHTSSLKEKKTDKKTCHKANEILAIPIILKNTFSYLDPKSLKTCAAVSKVWKKMSEDNFFWFNCCINDSPVRARLTHKSYCSKFKYKKLFFQLRDKFPPNSYRFTKTALTGYKLIHKKFGIYKGLPLMILYTPVMVVATAATPCLMLLDHSVSREERKQPLLPQGDLPQEMLKM